MQAASGRRRPLLTVLVLLVISVLLDRFLIAVLCPWIPSMGGISLMVVFLDIPVALPMIDPLPVAVLFSLFYSMIPVRLGGLEGVRLSNIWTGVFILACWMAAGALIYHFSQEFLPRQVRNGIDSFGIHADINTPFMEYSILHLRGGFILLLCFIIGGRTLVKRINRVAIAHPVPEVISAEPKRVSKPARSGAAPVQDVPVCTTIAAKPPAPVRARATTRSVAVVAPRRVEVIPSLEM
jgi:hypothetical protein